MAVIGSAASAVQICPAIVDEVEQLNVFQRTPNWIIPKLNPNIPRWLQQMYSHLPFVLSIQRLILFFLFELNGVFLLSKGPISRLYKYQLMKHYRQQVKDDDSLMAKVTPDFDIGCKRVLLANDFISTFADKANAELITTPITAINKNGIVTKDGKQYDVDLIVYATGKEGRAKP